MKIQYISNGSKRVVRDAIGVSLIARRLARPVYETRMLVADVPTGEPYEVASQNPGDLESMNRDELHALAKERGVKVHHLAGAEKVRAALREAAQ